MGLIKNSLSSFDVNSKQRHSIVHISTCNQIIWYVGNRNWNLVSHLGPRSPCAVPPRVVHLVASRLRNLVGVAVGTEAHHTEFAIEAVIAHDLCSRLGVGHERRGIWNVENNKSVTIKTNNTMTYRY